MVSIEELRSAIEERERYMQNELRGADIVRRELSLGRNMPSRHAVSIISGARRAGKSIYAFQSCQGKSFGYVNFEDERLSGITAENLNKVLEAVYSLK